MSSSPNIYSSFSSLFGFEPAMAPALQERAGEAANHVADQVASGFASLTSSSPASTDTIAPYSTDLNGVNQTMNYLNRDILWWTLGTLCMAVLVIRVYHHAYHYLRLLSSLSGDRAAQRFWSLNATTWWPKVKKHLIYAPLWKRQHNQEINLTLGKKKIAFGTVPSRAHTICLIIWIVGNFICSAWLDYSRENYYSKMAELRGRTGFLAIANMIVLIILAGRNNPLIRLLQVSFDDMNLFHRWIGRLVVLESLVHTFAWGIVKHAAFGFSGINEAMAHDPFIIWGWIATLTMLFIIIATLNPLRHAFYETFLNCHIIMAIIVFAAVYMHCLIAKLPQLPWMNWVVSLWGLERGLRMLRIMYPNIRLRNFWKGTQSYAVVEAMAGSEACRVTIHLPKSLHVNPGSHAYIRLWGLRVWECHPFSIAWVGEDPIHETYTPKELGLPMTATNSRSTSSSDPEEKRSQPKPKTTTSCSFIIGAQNPNGFTRHLHNKALASPSGVFRTSAILEGPYGGHHSLDSYGTVMLFAGATGITHQLSYVKHLVSSYSTSVIATKRIVLVWVVRDVPALEWIRGFMDEILRLPQRREVLHVKIFVTRPKNRSAIASPSQTVQMFPGRPRFDNLIQDEIRNQTGAMVVSVCGPGSMCDNIREVVRGVQDETVVDMLEESFTW